MKRSRTKWIVIARLTAMLAAAVTLLAVGTDTVAQQSAERQYVVGVSGMT